MKIAVVCNSIQDFKDFTYVIRENGMPETGGRWEKQHQSVRSGDFIYIGVFIIGRGNDRRISDQHRGLSFDLWSTHRDVLLNQRIIQFMDKMIR